MCMNCVFVLVVDLREVREIRLGKSSRDFERWKDEAGLRCDPGLCFVLLYGSDFRLKTLSLAGKCNREALRVLRVMCISNIHHAKTGRLFVFKRCGMPIILEMVSKKQKENSEILQFMASMLYVDRLNRNIKP